MEQLALKYRPKTLDDVIGQSKLLGENGIFRKMVEAGKMSHAFFYGPPGTGKTTLARIIASTLDSSFYELNATTLKVDDLRKIFKKHDGTEDRPTVFIDEVHRLSKNQQEVLLPFMENHTALIIGASTENPYYTMTHAMRSRSHLFELLTVNDEELLERLEYVMREEGIEADDDAKEYMVFSSNGDVRAMLNLLESASSLGGKIDLGTLKQIRPHAMQGGSSESENHYEITSAMIKSIRGSDVDAGLYWLGRLIEGGEPADFIARRLAILASEDVGNANPNAITIAASALEITKHIGYPEARITLAQLVVYLASSPKSNSCYVAINTVLDAIRNGDMQAVPAHVKTHGKNYEYPHNHGGWVKQKYMPNPRKFYKSSGMGFEQTLNDWLKKITKS